MKKRMLVLCACLLVAACAGGGGGTGGNPGGGPAANTDNGGGGGDSGGGEPAPQDESVVAASSQLSVANVVADGGAAPFPTSGDVTFPATAVERSPGNRRTAVTRYSNQRLSIVYETDSGVRRIDFRPEDLELSDTEVDIYLRGLHNYFEFKGLSETDPFEYMRVGVLFYDEQGEFHARTMNYGFGTPLARLKDFGSARYEGSSAGLLQLGTTRDPLMLYTVDADIQLSLDFFRQTFRGSLTNMVVESFDGQPLQANLGATFSGAMSTNGGFGSTVFNMDGSGPGIGGSGGLFGLLYGPNGEEVAGNWATSITGLDEPAQAWGAFGGKRASASLGAGTFLATYAGTTRTLMQQSVEETGTGAGSTTRDIPSPSSTLLSNTGGSVSLAKIAGASPTTFTFDDFTQVPHGSVLPTLQASRSGVDLHIAHNLAYSTYGYWAEAGAASPTVRNYHYFATGISTPVGSVPTSGVGIYRGPAHGRASSPEGNSPIALSAMINVDFSTREVNGSFVSERGEPIYRSAGGDHVSSVIAVGTLAGNTFAASMSGLSASVPVTGSMNGKLHGPAAQEMAGLWSISAPDLQFKAAGSFGAKR